MEFQLSGEVSDDTAQSIGKKLGAETIISGSIVAVGDTYRLRIRAISVETAQIQGMHNVDVRQDSRIGALTGTGYSVSTVPSTPQATSPTPSSQGFQGIWKRTQYNNTLTFTRDTIKSSSQNYYWTIQSVSGDVYRIKGSNAGTIATITIRLLNGDIVISGDSGSNQDNWNGTWKKQ